MSKYHEPYKYSNQRELLVPRQLLQLLIAWNAKYLKALTKYAMKSQQIVVHHLTFELQVIWATLDSCWLILG